MLDIGGAHGFFSVAICRRNPQLHATILELPEAVKHAAPLLANEKMGDRISYWEADLLTADLGEERYDLVFLAAVVHHFDSATNRDLMLRIARATRPGGIVAIWEPLRQQHSGRIRQFGGLMDLFFGLFSQAGTLVGGGNCQLVSAGRPGAKEAQADVHGTRLSLTCWTEAKLTEVYC